MTSRFGIVHARPTRGGHTAVEHQIRELAALGNRPALLTSEGPRLRAIENIVDLSIIDIQSGLHRMVDRCRSWIDASRIEVLHVHGRSAGVWARVAAASSRTKPFVIYTPHSLPIFGTFRQMTIERSAQRALLEFTDLLAFVSHSERSDWVRYYESRHPYILYPNTLPDKAISERDRPSSIPIGANFMLAPGGYHPQKRLEWAVRAAAARSGCRLELVVCGTVQDQAYRRRLEALALDVAARVQFLDSIEGIEGLLGEAELVLLPSLREGMPFVALEAARAQARVAWSNIPPHSEVFGRHGEPFAEVSELAAIVDRVNRGESVDPLPEALFKDWSVWADRHRAKFLAAYA